MTATPTDCAPKKRRTPWSGNLSNRHHSHIMLRRGRTGMPFSMMNAVMPFAPLSGCVFAYTITVSAIVPLVHLETKRMTGLTAGTKS